jgi:hypothetical protein
MRKLLIVLLVASIAWLLLMINTALSLGEMRLDGLRRARYWDEITLAIAGLQPHDFRYVQDPGDVADDRVPIGLEYRRRIQPEDYFYRLYRRIKEQVVSQGSEILPWQFWRTISVRIKPYLRNRGIPVVSPLEDPGRPALLSAGFRLLGGVAPWLLLWLAALCSLPLLAWMVFELLNAGRVAAGVAFPLFLASSWFIVGTLHMTHSATGFYLLALFLLVPLIVYAVMGRCRSPRLLIARVVVAGVLFAFFAYCRNASLALVPVFALTLALAARRVLEIRRLRAIVVAGAGLLLLFLTPYLLIRPSQQHPAWIGVWEGFGDFDREYGHAWHNDRLRETVMSNGGNSVTRITSADPFWGGGFELNVFSDKAEWSRCWNAMVEQQRLFWTITQWKLWPYTPLSGRPMRRATTANEGLMDRYYSYAPRADWFIAFGNRFEIPVPIMLFPVVALLSAWFFHRRLSGRSKRLLSEDLQVLACLALGSLVIPVAFSTASGQETEAFVIVYLLGGAFLLGNLLLYGKRFVRSERTDDRVLRPSFGRKLALKDR